ncbi:MULTISPECIES: alpha/beta hydrolase [unclassified Pseudonocardia]|uniref:RBBP9/YdeN family alpha/beta hydrolase n=1 Tax=unclassified Pseudonocardia TaxID=2619320 RepID=UPI00031F17EE|nr:alpha/beta hydrolase [Pseudonocardia sp. Ae707_Ps1]OLM17343.1 hypothetical protein Ae707Ps1_1602c [Pseudonocardia sp. Ae707_Ps1]
MDSTVVIVPGLRDHVADHWQTLLADDLTRRGRPVRIVAPLQTDRLSRRARVAALDRTVHGITGPILLVAHSAGVVTTVHWARTGSRPVRGALLATPADLELPLPEGYPTTAELEAHGWNPLPRQRLPFPSIVAASTDDPLGRHRRITGMAETWGSRLDTLGAVGHLNPAAGFGPWPRAEQLIAELDARGRPATGAPTWNTLSAH